MNSKNYPTPPILMEILFENELVNHPIKFEYIGDGLELVALAGVTTGNCYKCELTSIDPNISRGEKWSRQPISLNDEVRNFQTFEKRTPEKAVKYSKKFQQS